MARLSKERCARCRAAIAAKRIESGLSISELAAKAGLDIATVWKYENSEALPDLSSVCHIADALECSIDELLGRDVEMISEN